MPNLTLTIGGAEHVGTVPEGSLVAADLNLPCDFTRRQDLIALVKIASVAAAEWEYLYYKTNAPSVEEKSRIQWECWAEIAQAALAELDKKEEGHE